MLHPSQFDVNEAWIAFRVNEAPLETEQDGAFNCNALMDAASCFILDLSMIPAEKSEPSESDAQRMLEAAWRHKSAYPATLFVPTGQFEAGMASLARRLGISVVSIGEAHLLVFVSEARQSFKERFEDGR